jgi:hypothetical protein
MPVLFSGCCSLGEMVLICFKLGDQKAQSGGHTSNQFRHDDLACAFAILQLALLQIL